MLWTSACRRTYTDTVICWVCGNPVAEFLPYGIPPRPGRCPHCGAKPRNRAVLWYLREIIRPALGPGAELTYSGSYTPTTNPSTNTATVKPMWPVPSCVLPRKKLKLAWLVKSGVTWGADRPRR